MKRFLLAMLIVAGLCIPHMSSAQFVDQKCWTQSDCVIKRKDLNPALSEADAASGFIQDSSTASACGGTEINKKPVGFCLPAGQSETKISFGGETKFENVGTFIKSMYRYIIWLAGILAAAMLVVAGFQWAASGGNSDAISSAKKRIAGALSGLVLLLLSYVVLNTVNPYLVNFRLPQIWLINAQSLVPPYCSQLAQTPELAESKLQDLGPATGKLPAGAGQGEFTINPKDAQCGNQYAVEKGGSQMCLGSKCNQPSQICLPFTYTDPDSKQKITPHCESGDLVIRYSIQGIWTSVKAITPFAGLLTNQLEEKDWLDLDAIELFPLCTKTGTANSATSACVGEPTPIQAKVVRLTNTGILPDYIFIYQGIKDKSASQLCGDQAPIGFILKHELTENWAFTDPNMYVAWTKNNTSAIFGRFPTVYKQLAANSNWNTVEALSTNQYFIANPSETDLIEMKNHGWEGTGNEFCK